MKLKNDRKKGEFLFVLKRSVLEGIEKQIFAHYLWTSVGGGDGGGELFLNFKQNLLTHFNFFDKGKGAE